MRNYFFLSLSIAFNLLCNNIHAQKNWEVHLNLKGINRYLEGEFAEYGDLLVKKKISNTFYARATLYSYNWTRNNVNGPTFNEVKLWNNKLTLGIEKRSKLDSKLYFLRGVDVKCDYYGYNTFTDSTTFRDPNYKGRDFTIGLRGFVGVHYQLLDHFAISTETHLEVLRNVYRSYYVQYPEPIFIKQTHINFIPVQYLTVSFTF